MHDIFPFLFAFFFVIPVSIAVYKYYKARKESGLVTRPAFNAVVNSAVAYALAYNYIFFIQELFLVFGKNYLGLQAYLYHNNHNWMVDHPRQDLMQGSGAVTILLCGILFFILYLLADNRSWARLFYLWLSFQGLMQSLPQFATAKLDPATDTGQAFAYMKFSPAAGWLITICAFAIMIVLLGWFGKLFLQFWMDPKTRLNRFLYKRNIILFAAILGTLMILPFRIFPFGQVMGPIFLMCVTIPLTMAFSWGPATGKYTDSMINQRIFIAPVIFLVLLLLFFQGVLAKGVLFHP